MADHRCRRGQILLGLTGIGVSCLVLVPAPARAHVVNLHRNEIVLTYSGDAQTSTPVGYLQHGSDPVLAIGRNTFSLDWSASVVVRRSGRVVRRESRLTGSGRIIQDPDAGDPTPMSGPEDTPCTSPVFVHDARYVDGVSASATAGSLGFELTAPADPRWIATSSAAMLTRCYVQTTDSPGTLIGAGSLTPKPSAAQRKLQRALYPKFAIRKTAPDQTKVFDFDWKAPEPGLTGPYATVAIHVQSTVKITARCRRFDVTRRRCVKRYR